MSSRIDINKMAFRAIPTTNFSQQLEKLAKEPQLGKKRKDILVFVVARQQR